MKGLKGFIKTNKKVTYEGGKAYELSFRETIAEMFSLGLVKGNFYQSDLDVIENTREVMKKAREECLGIRKNCRYMLHTFRTRQF
ncbi:MAG TPA: hypothetical protein VF941_16600 [Clostridia bacterium]